MHRRSDDRLGFRRQLHGYGRHRGRRVYGVAAEQPPAEYPFGDVNRDRVVDAFDYQMLKAYVLGTYTAQHEEDVALMDILSDGSIDAFDYQIVKAIVLGTYKVD